MPSEIAVSTSPCVPCRLWTSSSGIRSPSVALEATTMKGTSARRVSPFALRARNSGRAREDAGMAIPRSPLEGEALLVAVTDAMVALHERYYHRPPGMARTQMMGEDLLACVLGGVYTDVEKTLIELE